MPNWEVSPLSLHLRLCTDLFCPDLGKDSCWCLCGVWAAPKWSRYVPGRMWHSSSFASHSGWTENENQAEIRGYTEPSSFKLWFRNQNLTRHGVAQFGFQAFIQWTLHFNQCIFHKESPNYLSFSIVCHRHGYMSCKRRIRLGLKRLPDSTYTYTSHWHPGCSSIRTSWFEAVVVMFP